MGKRKNTQKRNPQQQRRWQPLERAVSKDPGLWARFNMRPPDRILANDLYSVYVREIGKGALHISFHRHDRKAIRDWRHHQAIKNEAAGPERLAIEVFPPESHLVDEANEYHLWVLPPGSEDGFPFLLPAGAGGVSSQQELFDEYGRDFKGRQRDWQPGVPTGKGADA